MLQGRTCNSASVQHKLSNWLVRLQRAERCGVGSENFEVLEVLQTCTRPMFIGCKKKIIKKWRKPHCSIFFSRNEKKAKGVRLFEKFVSVFCNGV